MRNFGGFFGILDFGTILDWCVLVLRVPRIIGIRVAEFDKNIGNVFIHCGVASAFDVVAVKFNASIYITFPIFSDVVVLFE